MRRILTSILVGGAVSAGLLFSATRPEDFAHERHRGIFPDCTTCHAGAESGDDSQIVSVDPTLCAGCHDGQVRGEVSWTGYSPSPDNLKFTHSEHPRLGCQACHEPEGGEDEWAVQAAAPSSCMACHGGGESTHLAATEACTFCHVPAASTELAAGRIASFPAPPGHADASFLAEHGSLANANTEQCAVCHARESCTVCHVNPAAFPAIMVLASDERFAGQIAVTTGRAMPKPASHEAGDFLRTHGVADAAQCSTCHGPQACETCHAGGGKPESHQAEDFLRAHPGLGAADPEQCSSCHGPQACEDCHAERGRTKLAIASLQEFPHERHEGLFPTCEGCHAGVVSGDDTQIISVDETLCAGCHDAQMREEVAWTEYKPEANNLKFEHSGHPQLPCATCHAVPGAEGKMAVQAATPANCMGCHGGGQTEHLATAVTCETCHVPLTEATELSVAQVALFPMPATHGADDFLSVHASLATENVEQCSVCHARETCTVCHLNADQIPSIQALQPDERIATLLASKKGRWPTPQNHLGDDWIQTHGPLGAAAPERCSSCHAQQSCTTCHVQPGVGLAGVIAALPKAAEGGPQGAVTSATMPPHPMNFKIVHQTAAATESGSCSACHQETFCSDCHDASLAPSFHAVNYVVQHSADAAAEFTECASCHSNEVFCRDCHSNLGAGVVAGANGGFHDASTDWLLSHGRAARQGLETCTTCHQQTSCLTCHSAKAGWRVNPHGPDFDPNRVADRSQISCGICHFGFQVEGN